MPRRIISQDPVVIPSAVEKTYSDVEMTKFVARRHLGKMVADVTMTASDYDTGEVLETEDYRFKLDDFEQQIAQSPKMLRAWEDINDIMGLAYDFFSTRDKVNLGLINGDDVSALIIQRDAALAALRAPLV